MAVLGDEQEASQPQPARKMLSRRDAALKMTGDYPKGKLGRHVLKMAGSYEQRVLGYSVTTENYLHSGTFGLNGDVLAPQNP